MNSLLDFLGAVLYFAVNIVIFPLIIILDSLLGFVVVVKFTKKLAAKTQYKLRSKSALPPLPLNKSWLSAQ